VDVVITGAKIKFWTLTGLLIQVWLAAAIASVVLAPVFWFGYWFLVGLFAGRR